MPDDRRRNCQGCRKSSDEVGPISWRGLCETCFTERLEENVYGIANKSGPAYQRWRLGSVQALLSREIVGVLYSAGEFAGTDETG